MYLYAVLAGFASLLVLTPSVLLLLWFSYKVKSKRAPTPVPVGVAGASTTTTTTTPVPARKVSTWVKALLATVLMIILFFWGGEILSALKGWDWSTTSTGKFIEDNAGSGWSNLLWLFLLVPLYFLVGLPKGLAKNAGTVLSWGVAIIGMIGLVWFFTQDPLRWWHNDNIVRVDLNRVNSDTVSIKPDQTLIILVRQATVYGRDCTGYFMPAPKWREMYDMHQPEDVLISYTNQGLTTYVSIKEPYRTMLRDRGMTMDIWVYNQGC
ncbi:hypothetical protein A2592_03450 [Candidatus Kaiserbacteria bacterium RIFOXYD1_FULL_42_15]|uniref:Uncharacterized protein n=1 Tax=Candidatus Kaiserbacteria bacterium RIFOXYD1_FULL_42_15 TaxID=1798532 RepID=A0A1F6FPH1_9BACT|nr:MAG: hypothetical protein A2592_03450 [Candidatus Kaiserbacteria bacterium RIFOXYD1_FULL_42_15]